MSVYNKNNNVVTTSTNGIPPVFVSNNTSDAIYTSNGIVSGSSITSGCITISTPKYDYKLCGYKFKLDRPLSMDEATLIANISINGIRYYNLMVENGMELYGDLKEALEPILKVIERNEKIGSILKNNKNEKC